MPITLGCSNCGRGFRLPDSAAGKGFKCPDCGTIHRVPDGLDAVYPVADAGYDVPPLPKQRPASASAATATVATVADPSAPMPAPIDGFAQRGPTPVVVVDFRMRFFTMVWFLVKLSLAAIPAAFILGFVATAVVALSSMVVALLVHVISR